MSTNKVRKLWKQKVSLCLQTLENTDTNRLLDTEIRTLVFWR
jgi:hypothetical protein